MRFQSSFCGTLRVRLDGEAWQQFFDGFRSSAWRLELHQVYTMPGELDQFRRFVESGVVDMSDDDPWLARVRSFRADGRTIGRVHVVRRPLTDYLRYEFTYQLHAVRAGEDVQILDLTDRQDPGLLDEDFWIFDDLRVVKMLYRADGTQIGRELLDDPDLGVFRRCRELARKDAVPLAMFWSEHGDGA